MNDFDEIIGYEDIKTELKMICDIVCNPDKYKKLGVRQPKGLLLHGEPGVGKTTMAKCFVKATGRKAFTCRKKKPDGEFVKEVTELFDKAKENIPSIVFLDDMDKYANEDENHKNAEEFVTLQACIDDVKDLDVFIIATANDLKDIPDSLLRAGRFDKTIKIMNPKGSDAANIVAYYLSQKNFVSDINAKEVADILNGKSCAQLETVINEAGIYAGYANKEKIEMQDILKACLRVIYAAPEKSDSENEDIEKTAFHEAGHALIAEILAPGIVTIVTVRGNHGNVGGFTAYINPKGYWYSKKMMENRVITLLAGKAATEIMFGNVDVGANNDLHRAFDVTERMVDDYCSTSFDRWIQGRDKSNDLMARREMQISTEMEHFYAEAKRLLIENRDLLIKIAESLIEEKTITGTKLRNIISTV